MADRVVLCAGTKRGRFRGHVLCLVNGVNTRDLKPADPPLSADDRISIIQAISGG